MNLFRLYGVLVGLFLMVLGLIILRKKMDSFFFDDNAQNISLWRHVIAILFLFAGLASISAVLYGWPPIRGYIVPPPA